MNGTNIHEKKNKAIISNSERNTNAASTYTARSFGNYDVYIKTLVNIIRTLRIGDLTSLYVHCNV